MSECNQLELVGNNPMTAVDVRRAVNLVQEVMKEVMRDKEHYGKVPGCGDKPALFKSGAEKLAMTFRLAPEYKELPGSVEGDGLICYKIECNLYHIATHIFFGSGRGTCNSKEKKYRTRSVYANRATDEEKAIGKPETRRSSNGSYDVFIIPQDPWDLQNTIYKMACKRALVAAVLNATAASDIFTQDIEDLPEGTLTDDGESSPVKPPVDMPKAKNTDNGNDPLALVKSEIVKCREKLPDEKFFKLLGDLGYTQVSEIQTIQEGNKLVIALRKEINGSVKG